MASVALMKKLSALDPPVRDALLAVMEEVESRTRAATESVTRSAFDELTNVVKRFAEAQEFTAKSIQTLADAQVRTEERLAAFSQQVGSLAEAQIRNEQSLSALTERVDRLTQHVERLTEAQERTERQLEKLAQAQEQTERRLEELAQAQQRTERRLEELAQAQALTEQRLGALTERVDRLTERVDRLAEAQQRTERRLEELAQAQALTEQRLSALTERVDRLTEAQERTEKRLDELAAAQIALQETVERLGFGLGAVRDQVGGLSRTMAYALENEAYRHLPNFLKERYNIDLLERLVRTEIAGREVNFFGRVRKDGQDGHLVGESVLRLDDRAKLAQLQATVDAMEEALGGPVIPVIVTHFAKKEVLEKAQQRGILVIQSFEW